MNTDFTYCRANENNKQCKNCNRNIKLYIKGKIPDMLWYIESQEKNCDNFIHIK